MFFGIIILCTNSSEEYNLACALRQSISSIVKIFVIFLLPAALLGVPAKVIAIVAPLHLFAQFWYHYTTYRQNGVFRKNYCNTFTPPCSTMPSTTNT